MIMSNERLPTMFFGHYFQTKKNLFEGFLGNYMTDNQALIEKSSKVSWWQTFLSVCMSFLGVQKNSHRTRDFQKGSPIRFIIMGFVLTILFIVSIILLVNVVLQSAGVA